MLGGGTFVTQNKELSGTYHNFVSARRDFLTLADRGVVALPFVYGWGDTSKVLTLTSQEFETAAYEIFGVQYDNAALLPLREAFVNAHTLQIVVLQGAEAAKASNTFFTAKYKGTLGNKIKTVVRANVDTPANFDVLTYLDNRLVDTQTNVVNAAALVANDYAVPIPSATLAVNAGVNMTGGVDGTVTAAEYQGALDLLESQNFNTLVADVDSAPLKQLFINYTTRMRDEVGAKFQLVVHNATTPDNKAVINVLNTVEGTNPRALVYWTAGLNAGLQVNESGENRVYNGELTVVTTNTRTSTQLIKAKKEGFFFFHVVGQDVRTGPDINSLVTLTSTEGDLFKFNQTIRLIDGIAIDTATIFNTRYLGIIPNDESGRESLWADLVANRRVYENMRAIEAYNEEGLIVGPGVQKDAVVASEEITEILTMSKMYITTVVG